MPIPFTQVLDRRIRFHWGTAPYGRGTDRSRDQRERCAI